MTELFYQCRLITDSYIQSGDTVAIIRFTMKQTPIYKRKGEQYEKEKNII